MPTDSVDFKFERRPSSIIKVVCVGGGGGNAVNHMFRQGIHDVDFIVCNTDAQALDASPVQGKVQLGASLTEGRGAGNKPETGKEAARESIEYVRKILGNNTRMVFITAGMGGGTGTGGAPVIAALCREMGYLTVGIVTIPFRNEGRRRINQAVEGIIEMESFTDSLLVINNERIREMYGDFPISEAFAKADDILATAARGIAEIITVPGYINVDFADVETVMRNSGVAVMGTGISEGEGRAVDAVEKALNSPLLNNNNIRGARNVLLNINSGDEEVTMDEVAQITDYIQKKAGNDADIIWGNCYDKRLGNRISVTVIATGFNTTNIPEVLQAGKAEREVHHLGAGPAQYRSQVAETPVRGKAADVKRIIPESDRRSPELLNTQKKPEKDEFESLYPNTVKERLHKKPEITPDPDFSQMSEEDIDELDRIPAYLRKQADTVNLTVKRKEQVSGTSLSPDEEKGVYFRENTHIHKKVD